MGAVSPLVLPVLPTRDAVVLPGAVTELLVGRPGTIAALREAWAGEGRVLVLLQKQPRQDAPGPGDFVGVGTVAELLDGQRLAENAASVALRGVEPARLVGVERRGDGLVATLEPLPWAPKVPPLPEGLADFVRHVVGRVFSEQLSARALAGLSARDDAELVCAMSPIALLEPTELQAVLESGDLSLVVRRAVLIRDEVEAGPLRRWWLRLRRWLSR